MKYGSIETVLLLSWNEMFQIDMSIILEQRKYEPDNIGKMSDSSSVVCVFFLVPGRLLLLMLLKHGKALFLITY